MADRSPHAWQRAASFAARAHRGQLRKDGKTPYAAHPFRVAMVLRHVFGCEDEAALCAALLHDTIEDTPTDFDDIDHAFGAEVAGIVAAMTKDMRLAEPAREPAYDDQLRRAGWKALLVKLADVYDNLCDGTRGGPTRKMVEKAERAVALARESETNELVARAAAAVEELLRQCARG